MQCLLYSRKIRQSHIHNTIREDIIYIPSLHVILFRAVGGTFCQFEYGISYNLLEEALTVQQSGISSDSQVAITNIRYKDITDVLIITAMSDAEEMKRLNALTKERIEKMLS